MYEHTKLFAAIVACGETEQYADDAVNVMVRNVVHDCGASLRAEILLSGLTPTEDLIDELWDLCEEYENWLHS